MNIGILKEQKQNEHRVALTPTGVSMVTAKGHNVFVQSGSGDAADSCDEDYRAVGATVMDSAREVSENVDIIAKVCAPLPDEFKVFREVQTLYCYIYPETDQSLIKMLLEKRITGIALEGISTDDGRYPMLEPMSYLAGQQAIFLGAEQLKSTNGGCGTSLARFPGIKPASVVVLGAGSAGEAAARTAAALGSNVILSEQSDERIRQLAHSLPANVMTLHADDPHVRQAILTADLIVHATNIPANSNVHIITRDMLPAMKQGAVIVDVAAKPGGGVESIDRPTSHDEPTCVEAGVIHCAVPNLPGAVGATASRALETAHLPWLLELADKGVIRALKSNPTLQRGLSSFNGTLCHKEAGETQGLPWKTPTEALGINA